MIRCVMEIEVISENNITITAFQEIFCLEMEWEQYKSVEKWESYNRIKIRPEDDYRIEVNIRKRSDIIYHEVWSALKR